VFLGFQKNNMQHSKGRKKDARQNTNTLQKNIYKMLWFIEE
jgi:hypothetical protein